MKTERSLRMKTKRTRAAAMVEAAVVIPLLVSFLGAGTMLYRGYQTKLDANQGVRSAALDFAAHDCSGRGHQGGLGAAGKSNVTKGEATLPAPQAISGGGEASALQAAMGDKPSMSGQSGYAQASYGARTIESPFGGKAREGQGPSLTVHGESALTLCNEPPMSGDLVSMAKTIGGEVSKAAGGSANRDEKGVREDFRTRE